MYKWVVNKLFLFSRLNLFIKMVMSISWWTIRQKPLNCLERISNCVTKLQLEVESMGNQALVIFFWSVLGNSKLELSNPNCSSYWNLFTQVHWTFTSLLCPFVNVLDVLHIRHSVEHRKWIFYCRYGHIT